MGEIEVSDFLRFFCFYPVRSHKHWCMLHKLGKVCLFYVEHLNLVIFFYSPTNAFPSSKPSFAWSLYSSFVGDDKAPANLAELKRTHEMLPYRTMKMILRYTNPIRIMKAMMDLFMAQPLGSKSLMQR